MADLGSLWKYSPASIYLSESTQPRAMDLLGLLKSQFLCHLVFCYVFIASGLIINTVQLFTLLLWPINKQLFRRINCRLSYCVSSRKSLVYSVCILTAAGCRRQGWERLPGLARRPKLLLVLLCPFLCFWLGMSALSSLFKS